MNVGHADVACESCHRAAPGTLRQQLQGAVRTWAGVRSEPVDIGFQHVSSGACTACHDRPEDRHPGYRFLEPRFAAVRAELHPERCESCHQEHAGARVTAADTTYCRHCHGELVVVRDPLDVSHAELVKAARWESCLGCHDYHGNHTRPAPTRLDQALPAAAIRRYLDGGLSPYGPATVRATAPVTAMPARTL